MPSSFARVLERSREIQALGSASALLGWDQETFMPKKGGEGRAETLASLRKILQEKYTDAAFGDWLEEAAAEGSGPASSAAGSAAAPNSDPGIPSGFSAADRNAILRELKRDRHQALKIPPRLTLELSRQASLTQQAWAEARPKNDTAAFLPLLGNLVTLLREQAECLGYAESPYDALLDQYEPGMKASTLEPLFAGLRQELVPLVEELTDQAARAPSGSGPSPGGGRAPRSFALPPLSQDLQKKLGLELLQAIGFDLEAGRLDESAHPFTEALHARDVRLTSRYNEADPLTSLFTALHEGGHGLYEQGFEARYFGTPLAQAVSLGMHESQSRLWENLVGRSRPFWESRLPRLGKLSPAYAALPFEDFLAQVNRVEKSLIRVEADEVTYNLHVLLRFEIEKALLEGHLQVSDLEGAWNEKMKRYLGLVPDSPANGFMQDVHWSAGLLGYFPTYTLGNLYSAQLFAAAGRTLPDLDALLRSDDLTPLRDWLGDKVHRHGRRYGAEELLERATGEKPSARYFIDYLKAKYRVG